MQTKIKNLTLGCLAMTLLLCQTACTNSDLAKENLIPKPVSAISERGSFDLTDQTDIYIQGESVELKQIGQYLADKLNPSTKLGIEVKTTTVAPASGNIYLLLSANDTELGDEGYELTITGKLVRLTANKPAGLFHGIQTIRQLLPAKVEMSEAQKGPWKISNGVIRDYPSYAYRGSMLDVGRHFFEVDEVKKLIDQLAYYKFNVLHLSLTNDQGWRIEIKSWPNLTAHGGKTEARSGVASRRL